MLNRDLRDLIGGLVMMAIGIFAVVYAQRYDMGQLQRMGPGYFPIMLGGLLAILGFFIALPALFRQGTRVHIEWKSLLWVLASILLFAGLLETLGLIFTTMISVVASTMASTLPWLSRIILAVSVSIITYLIFSFGLGMFLPTWPWSY
jgi:hypothetical protein